MIGSRATRVLVSMSQAMSGRWARGVRLAAAAGLALALTAAPAWAQPGGGGGGGFGGGMGMLMGGGPGGGREALNARISSDDLERYAQKLGLAEEQRQALTVLHEAYLEAHQARAAAVRAEMEDARDAFRETRDPSVFQEIGQSMQAFRQEATAAEKQFMDDFQALLTPEQAAGWPALDRQRRRETTLRRGLISGERVDVVRLVDELDLAPEQRAALEPMLDAYSQELDPALVKRNELFEAAMSQGPQFFQAFRDGGDTAAAEKMITEGRDAAIRVRDINRKYAAQIAGLLAPEQGQAFTARVKRESFPAIYTQRYAAQVSEAALKFEDLTDAQRGSLEAIRESYQRETDALNARAEAAIEAQEKDFSIATMMQRFGGGGDDGGLGELRRTRRELENGTVTKIRELLTPEQAARLPERQQGGEGERGPRGRGRDRGMNGGGDNPAGEGERPRRPRQGRGGGGDGGGGDANPDTTTPPGGG